jgi:hypothetical protein
MKRQGPVVMFVMGLVFGMAMGTAEGGDVNVNIGVPPVAAVVVAPPPVMVARPQVVLVPGTPVFTAPNVEFNVFLFGGKYYSHHNDVWYVTPRPGAKWERVAVATVPVEVRGVPVKYYKVKPKHAKAWKHDDDDRGHGKGCPPGLAKQGRC